MSSHFIEIGRDDFQQIVPEGYTQELQGNEEVYIKHVENKGSIKIYSSFSNGSNSVRRIGSDAIRVVPLGVLGRPVGKLKKILRVQGWNIRLKERIQEAEGIVNALREYFPKEKTADRSINPPPVIEDDWDSPSENENVDVATKSDTETHVQISNNLEVIIPEVLFPDTSHTTPPDDIAVQKFIPSMEKRGIPGLNIIQTTALYHVMDDVNTIISSPTSSGKTLAAEIYMQRTIDKKGKVIYLSPLKAVSQEKYDDWKSPKHHFSDHVIEILTGDYKPDKGKIEGLEKADIISMTSEMLDHRVRMWNSPASRFLKDIRLLVVDEAHLITMMGRGGSLECGILRFAKYVPQARIMFLSATMSNVEELGEWLSRLNGKKSILIKSQYQPVPLQKHVYYAQDIAMEPITLINQNPDDCFLIFVHTKKVGYTVGEFLKRANIPTEFHNADLDRNERLEIERKFRKKELTAIIATSTLAYGINAPARRVIVCGTKRGPETVHPMDVIQEMGRAGRLGLDTQGDAYLLVDTPFAVEQWKRLILMPQKIESTLQNYDELIRHVVSEMNNNIIVDEKSFMEWYGNSLAGSQFPITKEQVREILVEMEKWGIIKHGWDVRIELTWAGRVAAMFYFHPFDIAHLSISLGKVQSLINEGAIRSNKDLLSLFCWAFAGMHSLKQIFTYDKGYSNVESLMRAIPELGRTNLSIAKLMERWAEEQAERKEITPIYGVLLDLERWEAAINALAKSYPIPGSHKDPWLKTVVIRLKNGVTAEKAELCKIYGVGRVRAEKLLGFGINEISDIPKYEKDLHKIFNPQTVELIVKGAKELMKAPAERKNEDDW